MKSGTGAGSLNYGQMSSHLKCVDMAFDSKAECTGLLQYLPAATSSKEDTVHQLGNKDLKMLVYL